MTRIDFYLTRHSGGRARETTVCKLAHKAFHLGHEIYILTANADESTQLDRLLWTFSAGSFIPHGLNTVGLDSSMRVIIGDNEPPESCQDVLISLTATVPRFFDRFKRVVDVVGPGRDARKHARERFRFYRERGYSLQTHNL